MCGIAGVLSYHGKADIRGALRAMVQAQSHRGPDGAGEAFPAFGRGSLGLGHRRLSVLDLSAAGHQPMAHPENGDWLVFNGEIYNFKALREALRAAGIRCAGSGDTEVLLHALGQWGESALPRLHGMYALAYYRARESRLLLARDPLGIKPLYLGKLADGWVFASEARAILASKLLPARVDPRGLASMLAYGSVQHPLTLIQGVESFPPGCCQWFQADGGVSARRAFWAWPTAEAQYSAGEIAQVVRDTLASSVREHLAADVPVGVFLSSGLDSTIVAGLAARDAPRLRSFTVGFADQPDMSEFAEAAQTAKAFGLDHTEIPVSNDQAQGAMQAWLGALDQPSIDGLNTYVISRAIRRQGITVALSGLGGDELFGGYSTFAEVPRLRRRLRHLARLPLPLRLALARAASCRKPESARQKLRDMLATDGSLLALYLQSRRALSGQQLRKLGLEPGALGLREDYLPPESLESVDPGGARPLADLSRLESRFYQANTLLRDTDANSMAHGLEIRVPMLGQPVVDLMATLPDALRLPAARADKHLLRQAFAPLLRPGLLGQAKMGFTLPIRRWMLGPLREDCEHALSRLKSLGILRAEGVDEVWAGFVAAPESPMWSRALALCVLGSYLETL